MILQVPTSVKVCSRAFFFVSFFGGGGGGGGEGGGGGGGGMCFCRRYSYIDLGVCNSGQSSSQCFSTAPCPPPLLSDEAEFNIECFLGHKTSPLWPHPTRGLNLVLELATYLLILINCDFFFPFSSIYTMIRNLMKGSLR